MGGAGRLPWGLLSLPRKNCGKHARLITYRINRTTKFSFRCPEFRPIRHFKNEFSINLKTERDIVLPWACHAKPSQRQKFLGRKLSDLESSIICGQCCAIFLGLHKMGSPKRDIPGKFNSLRKWAIFDHRSRHSPVGVIKAVRNSHLFR